MIIPEGYKIAKREDLFKWTGGQWYTYLGKVFYTLSFDNSWEGFPYTTSNGTDTTKLMQQLEKKRIFIKTQET